MQLLCVFAQQAHLLTPSRMNEAQNICLAFWNAVTAGESARAAGAQRVKRRVGFHAGHRHHPSPHTRQHTKIGVVRPRPYGRSFTARPGPLSKSCGAASIQIAHTSAPTT